MGQNWTDPIITDWIKRAFEVEYPEDQVYNIQ